MANASKEELQKIQDEKDRDAKIRAAILEKKTREIRRDALTVIPLLENKKFAKKAFTYFDIDTEASLVSTEVLAMLEVIVEEFREKVVCKSPIPTPVGFNYSLIKNQLLECIESHPSMDLKLFEKTMYDSNPFGMEDENLEKLEKAGVLREQLITRFFAENAYDTLVEDAFNANGEDPFTKKTLIRELESLNMINLAEKVREEHGEPDINFFEFYKVIYDEVHPGDMDLRKETRITDVDWEEEERIQKMSKKNKDLWHVLSLLNDIDRAPDAFKYFDTGKTGFINFEEFEIAIKEISEKASELQPPSVGPQPVPYHSERMRTLGLKVPQPIFLTLTQVRVPAQGKNRF